MCFWFHSVHSSLEPSSITIFLTSIFFNFPSTLAYIHPFRTYLSLLHPREKKLPLVTLPGCQARPLFPLLLHSRRVVCASCVLCITYCSPLTVRYWQRSPVSLQLPDPLASFFLLDFNYWHCDHLGLNQILPLPLPSWFFGGTLF